MIISVNNLLDKVSQYSFTSTSIAAGGTVVPVKNINSFTASHSIQIGKTGEEQTEIVLLDINTPSGTALTLAGTLRFNHSIDTPVYDVNYNQIIFKRSTVGTAGTALPFTGSTVSITPDSLTTDFNDTTGALTYAYKTSYVNSVTVEQTSDSAWFVPNGPTFYSLQKLRSRVKGALNSSGFIENDSTIDDWINEWQEQMGNSAIKVNQSYALGTTQAVFDGTAGYGTIVEPDFKSARKIEISYDGGATYTQSKEIPINQFSDSDIFTSVYPCHYWAGDTKFGVRPFRNGGTAKITYSKIYAVMTSDTDELSVVLRPYTTGCIDYALYRAYDKDQKQEYAESHFNKFKISKDDFISEITPRDQTGPKTVQFDESLSGRSEDFDLEYFAM